MKKSKTLLLILALCIFFVGISCAQTAEKHIHSREQFWLGYFNQTRFTDRWGMWADVHYRLTDNFVNRSFQLLVRPAITYFVKDNLRLNLGYAFVQHFPAEGMSTTRTEHRPWQQVWWNQKYTGLTTLQWLRLEQRFNQKVVADEKVGGFNYNLRVRYNFSFFVPLKGKDMAAKVPFAALANEVFLNFGDRIVYNTFDQNRFFLGVGYPFTSHLNMQLGYMNIYQQEGAGDQYVSTHAVRLYLFQSLDVRTKE